jgi:MFS family permease
MLAPFRSLRQRAFALLWSGQTVSRLGDNLYRLALAWWVLEKTGSASTIGVLFICSSVPMVLFMLLGGVTVDRFSRPRVMFAADVLRGVMVAIVTALAALNLLAVWHIYAASALFGLVSAFFQPAYTAIVPEIVPAAGLPSANSLTSLSGQMAGIAGPALGAGIIAAGGTPLAFGLDAASFVVSAACLAPLLRLPHGNAALPLVAPTLADPGETSPADDPRSESKARAMWREMAEGIRLVAATPWLWITIALASMGNMTLMGPFSVSLPFLVKEHMGLDVGALGLVYSLFSAGSVLGAVSLGWLPRFRRRGVLMYAAWFLSAAMFTTFGLTRGLPGLVVAAAAGGVALAACNLLWINTMQELVPRHLLGRVSSIDFVGSYIFLPVGYGVAGWVTDLLGAPMVFILGGGATMILVALGLLHPAVRRLD